MDPELLRYLVEEVGVRFESLRISTGRVENVDGTWLPATGILVDAGIKGELMMEVASEI